MILIQDYFQRVKFQNRGAAHTHACLWSAYSIEQMVRNNVILSDMPDPNHEPELFKHVQAHQIHTCNYRCGGQHQLTLFIESSKQYSVLISLHEKQTIEQMKQTNNIVDNKRCVEERS